MTLNDRRNFTTLGPTSAVIFIREFLKLFVKIRFSDAGGKVLNVFVFHATRVRQDPTKRNVFLSQAVSVKNINDDRVTTVTSRLLSPPPYPCPTLPSIARGQPRERRRRLRAGLIVCGRATCQVLEWYLITRARAPITYVCDMRTSVTCGQIPLHWSRSRNDTRKPQANVFSSHVNSL